MLLFPKAALATALPTAFPTLKAPAAATARPAAAKNSCGGWIFSFEDSTAIVSSLIGAALAVVELKAAPPNSKESANPDPIIFFIIFFDPLKNKSTDQKMILHPRIHN